MKIWQKLLAGILTVALLAGAVLCWGSVGSAFCVYGLIMMGAAYAVQRFLTHRSGDDYTME